MCWRRESEIPCVLLYAHCISLTALDIALIEAREEFIQRYKSAKSGSASSSSASSQKTVLPVLTSECPGFVCYAEKTQGEYILPYISAIKSPQQITGTLVKDLVSKELKIKPNQIYHVCIMPCYDKKLEGSRDDFYDSVNDTRQVDCVLTTSELKDILVERKTDLNSVKPLDKFHKFTKIFMNSDQSISSSDMEWESIDHVSNASSSSAFYLTSSYDSTGSGGYLENIFRYAAMVLFTKKIEGPLQ